jgi:hypothetical protein
MKHRFSLLLIFFLLTAGVSHAQDSHGTEGERIARANEILGQARAAVYQKIKVSDVKSLSLKDAGVNLVESATEVSGRGRPQVVTFRRGIEVSIVVGSPDNINHTTRHFNPDVSPSENYTRIEDVLSGEQAARRTDTITQGRAFDEDKMPDVPGMPESVKKQLRERIEKRTKTTREEILGAAAGRLFPVLLDTAWMNGKPLIYLGKADAGGTKADILEVKTNTGRQTRYFFDEKTHLLLMMTDEVSRGGLSSRVASYFSDYQLMDGLLVAKKINTETETTDEREIEVKGKRLKASNKTKTIKEVSVREFKINPKSKPGASAVKDTD